MSVIFEKTCFTISHYFWCCLFFFLVCTQHLLHICPSWVRDFFLGVFPQPVFFFMQLYSEFHRITNLCLPSIFYASLDKYAPQLLQLYKKRKTGTFGQKMEAIMMAFEEQVIFYFYFMHYIIECEQWTLTSLAYAVFVQQDKNDICAAQTAALAGLPHYLKEDSSEVFRTCKVFVCSASQCN